MIFSSQRETYIKRLPTVIDRSWGIQAYDLDNLYPQRLDEIRKRSFTLKSAIERISEFIDGEGFEDQILAKLILNCEGQTANDVLEAIAKDKSCLGFALHFKYNPFTFRIMEITPIEFMYSRFGLPDENGNVCEIAYCRNWEQDPYKEIDNAIKIEFFPVFNPDPQVVKEQIEQYGFDENFQSCFPGQVLYWTPKPGVYPEATFDAVADNAQTQSEVGTYQLATIQNDFSIEKIFKYPGEFVDKKAEQDFKDSLNPMMGAKGAKSTIVVSVPVGTDLPTGGLIESIQMQNTDKMYEFTSKDVRNAIREGLSIPAAILGQLPEAGMFNQEQITDSFNYFNSITRNHRNQISRVFERIMKYWKDPLPITSYKITPQSYGDTPSPAAQTALPGATPGQPAQAVERPQMNDALTKLTASQRRNFDRILKRYDMGNPQYTYERTFQDMRSFGLTDDEIKNYIGEEND